MVAHKNNTYAKKLTTIELKKAAFESYLSHLAKGKSQKSWWFDHEDVTITWQTMDTYIKNEPEVFSSIQIDRAKSQGYNVWEQVVEDSANGVNKDANTASLQMVMRNKFGWDKEDNVNKVTNEAQVVDFLRQLDTLKLPNKENLEEKETSQ